METCIALFILKSNLPFLMHQVVEVCSKIGPIVFGPNLRTHRLSTLIFCSNIEPIYHYHLIFTSRKEGAQRFRRWVTGEVLPTIRKTGSYTIPGLASEAAHMKDVDEHIEQIRTCASVTLQRLARLTEQLDTLMNKVQATYKKQKPPISTPDFETL